MNFYDVRGYTIYVGTAGQYRLRREQGMLFFAHDASIQEMEYLRNKLNERIKHANKSTGTQDTGTVTNDRPTGQCNKRNA